MQEIDPHKNILEVQDVSFSYGEGEVLSGITLAVPRGDYLGVVGPNGAGKTTLLKIVLGLLPLSRGSVRLFGKDIREFKEWARIGYVPQKAAAREANFPATVYEAVLMGRYARRGLFHRITEGDRRLAKKALEDVGMHAYKDRLVGDLSGGQEQRVFIARALVTEPDIIFLDEPAIGIDQKARDEFYALLKKLNREMRLTLILVSHDIEMITRETRHIACIDRVLVCHGSPEEFLRDSRSSDFFRGGVKIITHTRHHA